MTKAKGEVHENLLVQARAFLQKKYPYWMPTLYSFNFFNAEGYPDVDTACVTENLVLAYNPAFIAKQSYEEVAGLLAHECSHVLRDYFRRVRNIGNPDLYGVAADIPINEDLRAMGMKLPSCGVFPETYNLPKGLSAEEYYQLLLQKTNGSGGNTPRVCLSGGCSVPPSLREALSKHGVRTEIDRQNVVRQTLQAMQKHSEKTRGHFPSSFSELFTSLDVDARIDWRARLQGIIRRASGNIISGGDDYSRAHPSKRSYMRGLILSGLIDQEICPMFIIDTSGSMDMKKMLMGIAESIAVLQQFGVQECWLCMVDAGVALPPKKMSVADLLALDRFHGRGGTYFTPGFEAASALRPPPDLVIYFTDGEGSGPKEKPPEYEVVWCLIPHQYNQRVTRPTSWGEVVIISDDPKQMAEEDLLVEVDDPPDDDDP